MRLFAAYSQRPQSQHYATQSAYPPPQSQWGAPLQLTQSPVEAYFQSPQAHNNGARPPVQFPQQYSRGIGDGVVSSSDV